MPAIHRILPDHIDNLIVLDLDMKVETDIKDLYDIFDVMRSYQQLMALAFEQSPVYYHVTTGYRDNEKYTMIGKPPPHGFPGFNGGVKLMRLDMMRKSKLYNMYLDHPTLLNSLADKFHFKGHLGDQDFYTLLSFKYQEWFFRLPCQWNRQLCEWWKWNGYGDVFELYHNCSPPYYVIHGNCQTRIKLDNI